MCAHLFGVFIRKVQAQPCPFLPFRTVGGMNVQKEKALQLFLAQSNPAVRDRYFDIPPNFLYYERDLSSCGRELNGILYQIPYDEDHPAYIRPNNRIIPIFGP